MGRPPGTEGGRSPDGQRSPERRCWPWQPTSMRQGESSVFGWIAVKKKVCPGGKPMSRRRRSDSGLSGRIGGRLDPAPPDGRRRAIQGEGGNFGAASRENHSLEAAFRNGGGPRSLRTVRAMSVPPRAIRNDGRRRPRRLKKHPCWMIHAGAARRRQRSGSSFWTPDRFMRNTSYIGCDCQRSPWNPPCAAAAAG